jgi:hypothetical protein
MWWVLADHGVCYIEQHPLVTHIVCEGQAARYAAGKREAEMLSKETVRTVCSCTWAALHVCCMASLGFLFLLEATPHVTILAYALHMYCTGTQHVLRRAAAACVMVC